MVNDIQMNLVDVRGMMTGIGKFDLFCTLNEHGSGTLSCRLAVL